MDSCAAVDRMAFGDEDEEKAKVLLEVFEALSNHDKMAIRLARRWTEDGKTAEEVGKQQKDCNGVTPLDLMGNNTLRAIWGRTHQIIGKKKKKIGTVADKSSDIDRLNYLIYARALAYSARQAELPGISLCVGLYARYVASVEPKSY